MLDAIKADMAVLVSREFLLFNFLIGSVVFGWLLGSCRRYYLDQVDGRKQGRFFKRR